MYLSVWNISINGRKEQFVSNLSDVEDVIRVYKSHFKKSHKDKAFNVEKVERVTGIDLIGDGKISDGYHTFDELYHHRMVLFSIICNQNKDKAWKSRLHDDGTMYDNYFIVGITTEEGDYTYHYHLDNWKYFNVKELPTAPKWDGHKPEDITRLLSL